MRAGYLLRQVRPPADMDYVILGGGSVTAEYYLPALKRLGKKARVVDRDESSLAALRPHFHDALFLAQDHNAFLNELLGGGEEPIIVALPNHLHVDAVKAALAKGRNVLCEKPLSLRAQDCRDLGAEASRARKLLKVAMSRRYLPS